MPASVSLSGLSCSTPDGTPLFTDLNLTFGPERTGLVGRNGTGKSTLLRLISGDLHPASGQVRVFVTTPYYVPNAGLQAALCACANRGVDTTIIFPACNDDFAVAAASRSYYADLLDAGVTIFEYEAGLLHAKTLTMVAASC